MALDEKLWFRPFPHGDPPWFWGLVEKLDHPDWQKAAGVYLRFQEEILQSQIKFVQGIQGVISQKR